MSVENNKELRNLRILREIRINGKAQPVGSVIPKSAFQNAGDWLNLAAMTPTRVEQTDDKVGDAPKAKGKTAPTLPGS